MRTSPDGITWTARTGTGGNWRPTTYNGSDLFVAVGDSGVVMTSPDGITWTARTAAEGNNWYNVTYGNGLYVAVSIDGTNRVMTSADGITWTSQSSSEQNSWYGVSYGNGVYAAVSRDGTNRVMTRPDGTGTPSALRVEGLTALDGATTIKADNSSLLSIQSSSGSELVNVDTISSTVTLGDATNSSSSTVIQGGATSDILRVDADNLTTGNGLVVNSSSASATSADLLSVVQDGAYTGTEIVSGSSLSVSRDISTNNPSSPTVTRQATSDQSTNSSSLSYSHTVTAQTNQVLVVTVEATGTTSDPASVTFDGQALTMQDSATSGTRNVSVWYLVNPPVTTANVVVSSTGGSHTHSSASNLYNVDQTTPISDSGSDVSASNPASVDVTSTSAGDLVFDLWASNVYGGPGGGQTQYYTNIYTTGFRSNASYKAGTSGNVSMQMSGSTSHAYLAYNVKATSALGVGVTGSTVSFSSDCTVLAGACYDSSNVVDINQQYIGATGSALRVTSAGIGNSFEIVDGATTVLNVADGGQTVLTANGGTNVALTVNNSTSSGNIAQFQDNGVNVLTVGDGGTTTATGAGVTTGNILQVDGNSLTSGTALLVQSSSANLQNGDLLAVTQTGSYTNAETINTNVADFSRSLTTDNTSVVVERQTVTSSSSSSSSLSYSHTVTVQTNQVLIVTVENSTNNNPPDTVTFDGNPLTMEISATDGSRTVSVWYLVNPPATTANVSITGAGNYTHSGASNVYNVDLTDPISDSQSDVTTSNPASVNVTSTGTGDLLFDIWGSSVYGTPGGGQTEYYSEIYTSGFRTTGSYKYGSAGSVNMQMSGSTAHAYVAYNVKMAASPGIVVTDSVLNLSSNCAETAGTCYDSGSVLSISQNFTGSTGAVLNLIGAGAGNLINLIDGSTTVLSVADGGATTLQNSTDSTSAFSVQNAAGTNTVLNVDTTNGRVGIGTSTPGYTLEVDGTVADGALNSLVNIGGTVASTGSDRMSALYVNPTITVSTPSNISLGGVNSAPTTATANLNAGVSSALGAFGAAPTYTGTSTLYSAFGYVSEPYNASTGTITEAIGYLARNPLNPSGTITNAYGIDVVNQTAGSTGNYNVFLGAVGSALPGNFSIFSSSTYDSYFAGSVGIGESSPATELDVSGTVQIDGTSTNSSALYLNNVLNGNTASQNGLNNQVNYQPGALTTAVQGFNNIVTVESSANNTTITAGYMRIDTAASYTGTITTAKGLQVASPSISGSNLITNYWGFQIENPSGNSGNTSGSISNTGLRIESFTSAAGSGGSLTNRAIQVSVPNGIGAGTTNNQGIYLTGGSAGSNNFAIYNESGAANYLEGDLRVGSASDLGARVQVDGDANEIQLLVQGHSTQSSDIVVIETSGGTDLFTVDTSRVQIGEGEAANATAQLLVLDTKNTSGDPSGVSGAMYYNSNEGAFRCYTTKWVDCNSAGNTVTVELAPEYAGAIFQGDGTNNTGTMNSGFCSGSSRKSINTSICAATDEHNYYEWTTASGDNDYDIYIRYQVPSDFDGFVSDTTIAMDGWRTDNTNNKVELALFQEDNTQCGTTTEVATGTGTWTNVSLGGSETGCSISADDIVVFRVRLTATASEYARAGAITFSYTTAF